MKLFTSLTLLAFGSLVVGSHTALAQVQPFLGQIMIVPYNFAPQGWAFCNGQILPIAQNTALFSLLGTTYGGDGQSTFALPDLQGRFPLGAGNGAGRTARVVGETGGAETVTLTINQLPAHSHAIVASEAEATLSPPTNAVMAGKARVPLYAPIGAANTTMAPTASTGGNQPAPVMPPFTTINYCIALEGVYPSRN